VDVGARIRSNAKLWLGVGLLALVFASPAAATPFTWTGLAPVPNFSSPGNWDNGSPLSAATSLTFGALSGQCGAPSPLDTCYRASNDASGVSVDAISFDGSQPYVVQGKSIALGAGGFTAVDGGGGFEGAWVVPLNLTASQTWSVMGPLTMGGPITGPGSALTVNFGNTPGVFAGWFLYGGDSEVGPLQLNGGQLQLGASTGTTMVNATDGQPVGLGTSQLFLNGTAAVGPLTSVASRVDLSTHALTVEGQFTADAHSTVSSLIQAPGSGNFGVLTATGGVTLAGKLDLEQIGSGGVGSACSPLPAGTRFTIASAASAISGTFANAPPGATLPTWAGCPRGEGITTVAKIGYNPNSVTATIAAAPSLSSVVAALSKTIKPSHKRLKIGALLKHGGYKISWPAFAGLLSVNLAAKVYGKQIHIAVVNTSFNGAQKSLLSVKLTKAGRRLLSRVSKLKVRATGVFEPVWDPLAAPAVHRTFRLKR
jgi:hypothetical protein